MQTNVNEVWGGGMKVNSLQDLGKLVAAQPTVQTKLELEEAKPTRTAAGRLTGDAWREQHDKIKRAVDFSFKNADVPLQKVADMFGIAMDTLYGGRYTAKLKMKKKMAKARAAKQAKVTNVTETKKWVQAALMTSVDKLTNMTKKQQSDLVYEVTKGRVDNVNHPAHYKTGGIETIDFIEAKQLTYNLGNVVKYITRAGIKDEAKHVEDLEKAAWYLNREIQNLKK